LGVERGLAECEMVWTIAGYNVAYRSRDHPELAGGRMSFGRLSMTVPADAIACFVPGFVLRQLAESTHELDSGGHQTERFSGAVLFSDIAGFTALAERPALREPAGTA